MPDMFECRKWLQDCFSDKGSGLHIYLICWTLPNKQVKILMAVPLLLESNSCTTATVPDSIRSML